MNQKLITALEVAAIMGLMVLVLFWGGLFSPASSPVPVTETRPQATDLIAFTSTRDDNFEIYVVRPDGSGEADLTLNPASDLLPVWSPDGARIAFYSDRTGWPEIFVMNLDGSEVVQVTEAERLNVSYAGLAWSPDGKEIAAVQSDGYQSMFLGDRGPFTLERIRSDGSGTRQVFQSDAKLPSPPYLHWSPDGRYLTLSQMRLDPDAATVFDTTFFDLKSPQAESAPRLLPACKVEGWFPSGEQVLCLARGTLFQIRVDGTGAILLLDSVSSSTSLALSTDGRYILHGNGISIVEHDNSAQLLSLIDISAPGRPVELHLPASAPIGQLSWAPGNRWFAYGAASDSENDIYIASIDDPSNPMQLTDHAGYNYAPQWQPRP